ncbi:MAG: hypothetical protein IKN38_03745 [Clostridia bacterium]|nr:hypothetical protein [Clostridia bacterium]
MNAKRIISLLTVCVLLCTAVIACFASCGGKKEVVNVTVKFLVTVDEEGNTLPADEQYYIGEHNETVEGTSKSPATVLKAAEQALTFLAYEDGYELTKDGYSIARVSKYAEHQETDDTTGYFTYWVAYVNGSRPVDGGGRQSEVKINEGDVIEFRYVYDSRAREDNKSYAADSE